MSVNIEVPDLSAVLVPSSDVKEKRVTNRAIISDLYFEENDEIEKGELFAVLFNENGTCDIIAPTSGTIVSLPCVEGDSVASEEVLATVETDR